MPRSAALLVWWMFTSVGPAVGGGRVFVTDYVTSADVKQSNFERKTSTGTERVLCLDEATGKVLWKHEYPVTYTISYPAGPRCTPTVDGDRLVCAAGTGVAHAVALDKRTGKEIWRAGTAPEQGERYWMFAETGDLVIAKLSAAGYEELDRAQLLAPTNTAFGREVVWCPPAYANRAIVVRNDKEIIRVSLAAE